MYIEPMITVAKEDTLASRRYAFDRLRSRESVGKLFTNLGPRFEKRPGGYTRIIKCGNRPGDNAPMAIIELVDRAAVTSKESDAVVKKPAKSKVDTTAKEATEPKAKVAKAKSTATKADSQVKPKAKVKDKSEE